MICIWQVFGDIQDLTYIAEIFILNFGGTTTICGNRILNEKVWIKVMLSLAEKRKKLFAPSGAANG